MSVTSTAPPGPARAASPEDPAPPLSDGRRRHPAGAAGPSAYTRRRVRRLVGSFAAVLALIAVVAGIALVTLAGRYQRSAALTEMDATLSSVIAEVDSILAIFHYAELDDSPLLVDTVAEAIERHTRSLPQVVVHLHDSEGGLLWTSSAHPATETDERLARAAIDAALTGRVDARRAAHEGGDVLRRTEALRGPDGEVAAVVTAEQSLVPLDRSVARARPALLAVVVATLLAVYSLVLPLVARLGTRLGRSSEQLATMLDVERHANEELRRVDAMKDAFLTAVSHELRTPLTVIAGNAQVLLRHDEQLPDDLRRELTRRLANNAERLERLLTDLLDVDRLTRGVLVADRTPVDVTALAREVISQLAVGQHEVRISDAEVIAEVDAAYVARVIENLVANAAKYSPSGTCIEVDVAAMPDGGAVLSVADRGAGIPEADLSRVFDVFVRLESGGPVPGTGVGLALVNRIAELHGGQAWAERRPGGGSVFRVSLPAPG